MQPVLRSGWSWLACAVAARRLPRLLCSLAILGPLLSGCRQPPAHPPGQILYRRYCASCHGLTGKGDGPVAASLRRPPTDLTTMALRAGGRFDEADVAAVIDGRRSVAEHGPRDMPVWGVIFDQELAGEPYAGYQVLLRSQVLADYLRSIQGK